MSTQEIITLPTISTSAPVTRNASRLGSPRSPKSMLRTAISSSMPTSPKTIAKRNWRVIKSNVLLQPVVSSPGRALRKSTYAATFGTMPRTLSSSTLSNAPAVHAYADPISTLKHSGYVTFGKDTTARGTHATDGPPTHSYASLTSTLKRSGTTAFSKDTTARGLLTTDAPAVHSYADPTSTLKRSGATAFSKSMSSRSPPSTNGPPIHSYASPTSTLKRSGTTAFSKDTTARGLLTTDGPPVHSYADPTSTLKRSGVAPFGRSKSTTNLNARNLSSGVNHQAMQKKASTSKPVAPKLVPIRVPSPISVGDELESARSYDAE